MTVYDFYLFDRNGNCLYYAEWNRKHQPGISKEEEFKLMYGMIFSIKSFINRISPKDVKYKLHFYETPSGLKFIMNTDLNVGNIRDVLQQMFSSIYVEYVVKNPLTELGEPITSELFRTKMDDYVRGLPFFASKAS
ncbi:trafficking protein particle complex subunit 1-like isoform X2 [Babylonia areolata]|uniref:trafficking protein particle complex subunit 1-like isoform X2 n=1 Tax=Babylonia areolata TaxID=304850 RepID=UPI003FD1C1B4